MFEVEVKRVCDDIAMTKKHKLIASIVVLLVLAGVLVYMYMPTSERVEPEVADAATKASAAAVQANPPEPEPIINKRGGTSKSP